MTEYPKLICTLPADSLVGQIDEWTQLREQAVTAERVSGGVALTFPPELFEELADLAAREAECCSFLDLETSRSDHGVRLVVTSDAPEALPMIEMLAWAPA